MSRGNQLLFLPKYSPNLNHIEHDFSALKRVIMYASINTFFLMKIFVIFVQNSVLLLFKITISSQN